MSAVWSAHSVICENQHALPRFRIAHELSGVEDENAAERRLYQNIAGRNHAEPSDPVVIEADEDGELPHVEAPPTPSGEYVRIQDVSEPDRLSLDVKLERDGLVVIADTFYPGWVATVDGSREPIHAADVAFRAVAVPAGEHRVTLRYRPVSFRLGLGLFVIALGALAAIALRGRRGDVG